MAERRLDRTTIEVVKTAWNSLVSRYQKDPQTGEEHWTDNEGDTGFLKDVDALNALVEPYLLSPSSFVDPPLKMDEIKTHVELLLKQVAEHAKLDEEPEIGRAPRGFSAAPYPYVQLSVDFVDSASAVVRLICNVTKLFNLQKQALSKSTEKLMADSTRSAVEFLLEARIEDKIGVRWAGFAKKVDPPGRFANLFFTDCASMALQNVLDTQPVSRWITPEQREQIEQVLPKVITWVAKQYDSQTNVFFMDEARTTIQPVGLVYALEMLYTLAESLPEDLRTDCAKALEAVASRMTDLSKASALQTDFFHTLPLPTGPGSVFYDDRRYIGAFLSLFALAKTKDPNVLTDSLIQAGEVLYKGVSYEWIDDPTELWDDGRPLICFSQDALIGLVNYGLAGIVDTVTLLESDLRGAIRDALKSDEVVDVMFTTLLDKARIRKDKELRDKLAGIRAAEK